MSDEPTKPQEQRSEAQEALGSSVFYDSAGNPTYVGEHVRISALMANHSGDSSELEGDDETDEDEE